MIGTSLFFVALLMLYLGLFVLTKDVPARGILTAGCGLFALLLMYEAWYTMVKLRKASPEDNDDEDDSPKRYRGKRGHR